MPHLYGHEPMGINEPHLSRVAAERAFHVQAALERRRTTSTTPRSGWALLRTSLARSIRRS